MNIQAKTKICPYCDGRGKRSNSEKDGSCYNCWGSGTVPDYSIEMPLIDTSKVEFTVLTWSQSKAMNATTFTISAIDNVYNFVFWHNISLKYKINAEEIRKIFIKSWLDYARKLQAENEPRIAIGSKF